MSVKIVAFCCNWCSYAGADLAGTSRLGYPDDVKIIRVPCSCRVSEMAVLRAFWRGADGVIICGCHLGDCHYATGNYHTQHRMTALFAILEFLGIEGERLRLEWISAAEGQKFAAVMADFAHQVKMLVNVQDIPVSTISFSITAPAAVPAVETTVFEKTLAEMRTRARALLSSGKITQVLAWEQTDLSTRPAPAFFANEDAISDMTYNSFCTANLSKYLIQASRDDTHILVFLRPCDAASFARLVQENQIVRENIYVIGINCSGCIDTRDLPVSQNLLESCQNCTQILNETQQKDLLDYDEYISEISSHTVTPLPDTENASSSHLSALPHLDAATTPARRAFWHEQLSRCIRCYACRNVCPTCHCRTCVFDGEQYDMRQKANVSPLDSPFYHAIRALHQGGRCTGCGQCSRVCPQKIPLHLINRKLKMITEELEGEKL